MKIEEPKRLTPDEWLARVRQESDAGLDTAPQAGPLEPGRHKIFLGFAAGVGKTHKMLDEGNRRKMRGQDVVIGYVETHKRKGTQAQLGDLELIPRKKITYRGLTLEEMDTDAIIERRPRVALVDELAHTNVPGSAREKRWQDVDALLAAGITVLSTVNVQHLESLNDNVYDITGVRVRETVPDRVLREADEVTIVDITPRALINRLKRGDIYAPNKVEQALDNWFREGNLSALREIALREVAREVDDDLTVYRKAKHIEENWATADRVVVCLSPNTSSMRLLRRAYRIAQRLQGDLRAVYVADHPASAAEQLVLHNDFALAQRLDIPVVTLSGDVATEVIRYCIQNQVTQLVLGHSSRSRWQEFVKGSIVNRVTRALRSVDILLVTERGAAEESENVKPA